MYKLLVADSICGEYELHAAGGLEWLKDMAKELDKTIGKRWVIVDRNDDPVNWSSVIQGNLEGAKKVKAALATDDKYLSKLAKTRGIKVISSAEMMAGVMDISMEEAEKNVEKVNKEVRNMSSEEKGKILKSMKKMVSKGLVDVIKTDTVERKLYGRDSK